MSNGDISSDFLWIWRRTTLSISSSIYVERTAGGSGGRHPPVDVMVLSEWGREACNMSSPHMQVPKPLQYAPTSSSSSSSGEELFWVSAPQTETGSTWEEKHIIAGCDSRTPKCCRAFWCMSRVRGVCAGAAQGRDSDDLRTVAWHPRGTTDALTRI